MKVIKSASEFVWDKGNIGKNLKHNVEDKETEEVFLDEKRFIFKDRLHSGSEERFRIVGKTKNGKLLFIAFTIREDRIRIISARNINKKEVYLYEKKFKTA